MLTEETHTFFTSKKESISRFLQYAIYLDGSFSGKRKYAIISMIWAIKIIINPTPIINVIAPMK